MKKYLLVPIVLATLFNVFPGVVAAQSGGASCDAGNNTPGTFDAAGNCVPDTATPALPNTNATPQAPSQSAVSGLKSGFTALAPIYGLTDSSNTSVVNSDSLAKFLNNLYKYLIGLAATLAVIMIIWGGFEISTQDSISKQGAGREKIRGALFGLVLVLSPVLVFSVINPSILNLSINLPALDTKSGSQITNTHAATVPVIPDVSAPATGCTTTYSSSYFQTAKCATQTDLDDYVCGTGLSGPSTFIAPPCKGFDGQGNPTCTTGIFVFCSKTQDVTHYAPYYSGRGFTLSSAKVVPRDAQVEAAFSSACTEGGGRVTGEQIDFQTADVGNCPADSQVPGWENQGNSVIDYVIGSQTGNVCWTERLKCWPPTSK